MEENQEFTQEEIEKAEAILEAVKVHFDAICKIAEENGGAVLIVYDDDLLSASSAMGNKTRTIDMLAALMQKKPSMAAQFAMALASYVAHKVEQDSTTPYSGEAQYVPEAK